MAVRFLGIIDCGVGNHQSVVNALAFLGVHSVISHRMERLEKANGLILPGVGAFGEIAQGLKRNDITPFIKRKVVKDKTPLLGICLGMHVLAEGSEEDPAYAGLGLIPGRVQKLREGLDRRIPHVGWNDFSDFKQTSPILQSYKAGQTFYFDHSYHFSGETRFVSSKVYYGEEVVASIESGHIFGVQFHPEKSQLTGLRLLRAFANYCGVK